MFEHDAAAVPAPHSSDAALATRLVAAARYDLLRRQNGNLTVTSSPPVTTAPVITPSVVTTTNAQGHTVVATIIPGGGIVDSIVLETTRLPNGQLSTFTSYVSAQGTGAAAPHLQSVAPPARRGLVTVSGVLLVAVAFGALML